MTRLPCVKAMQGLQEAAEANFFWCPCVSSSGLTSAMPRLHLPMAASMP